MCDPTALAISSLILGVGSTVAKGKAQDKAAAENEELAKMAMREASKDISLLQQQTIDKTIRTIQEADRAARSEQALAIVSANEAGVTGASVEALLGDIDRKAGEFRSASERNLDSALDALQREKKSGRTIAQQRIAAVQPANPWSLGIEIAGHGLSFWAGQIARKPSSSEG